MKTFTVSAADNGQRLNRYLEKQVPSLYLSLMYKYLRLKRIKVNNKRCEASTRLSAGDIVSLYIDDSFFEKAPKKAPFMLASDTLTVLYEDYNIALLYKPAGLLVHEDNEEFCDTLINRFLKYLNKKGEYDPNDGAGFVPALCNRLDRGTSGIVIAAKNSDSLREMNEIIKERSISKLYLCATIAKPPKDGVYTAYLVKNEKSNTVTVSSKPIDGGKTINTGIKTIKHKNGLYLVEVDLLTGRTHQIRAHLQKLGCPLLGDGKYGNGETNKRYNIKRQALCAYKLVFNIDSERYPKLGYLDGKSFIVDDIWFKTTFFD